MSKSPDRQASVLDILRKGNRMSTKRIIELACSPEFQEIWWDCGVDVYETAMKLRRAGLITRTLGEGGFVWALVEHGWAPDTNRPLDLSGREP